MALVDVHVHLNDPAYTKDLHDVLSRAAEAGVERMIVAGYDLPSSIRAVEIAGLHDTVWAVVGVSPHEARTWDRSVASEISQLARRPKVVGIGEIGLDYHYDLSPRPVQRAAFEAQIELAASMALPIVVHNREAHQDTLTALRSMGSGSPGGMLHCFSGSLETALTAWRLGFHLSFAGPLTFKNAERLRETAARLPLESLLTETDAPYLTPHPHRGRRNEPAHVALVTAALAETQGLSLEKLASAVWTNAERVFGFN